MNFHQQLIDFFKKHNMYEENMFNYFKKQCTLIDYNIEEHRAFIGTYPLIKKNSNSIIGLKITVPYIINNKTMLINIHELVHAIEYYERIGKKYKSELTEEALPLLYEKLFILEKNDPELTAYGKYLDRCIQDDNITKYSFGLDVRDTLLNNYSYDMHKMQKLVKKMAKKS